MYEAIPLEYSWSELSPYISEEAIKVHYNMYQKNLDKLNELLKSVNYNYSYSLRDLMTHIDIFPLPIRGEILYYLSSVLNHDLYFYNISNKKNILPSKKIEADLIKNFGSYENFKKEFINKAENLKGSGYTFLVKDDNGVLKIINTSNEDSPYSYGMIPIIGLDLWEHAYFLDYKKDRSSYISNFFKIIDFDRIEKYYEQL